MSLIQVPSLGVCRFASPLNTAVDENVTVPLDLRHINGQAPKDTKQFELAGPRKNLFFYPPSTTAAIVTCGGLCPGLNNVIRSVVLQLYHGYGVKRILGFVGGYQGLDPRSNLQPLILTPEFVEDIHKSAGTVLKTSRGPVDAAIAVQNLIRLGVNVLFTVGGDGTQRGSKALYLEAKRRGYPLAVIGIPKTIDNDIPYVSRSFGFLTAMEQAREIISRAHAEVHSVINGIAVVRVMGREAGFIAVHSTIASQDVNFCLIPEVPFCLDGERGFLARLKERVLRRSHAVIVVAEGAGQNLLTSKPECDASGNSKLQDIAVFLEQKIDAFFKAEDIPCVLRHFDPRYEVRSCPPDAEDAILCDLFARNAVHAAMSGRTGMFIGSIHDNFVHVPGELPATPKRVDPLGMEWQAVLACTGQPEHFN